MLPKCVICLIRQSIFAHNISTGAHDVPAKQSRYYWTATRTSFKMCSTLNCLNIVCIVSVSDVAAAYLLKIRQATYSFIRHAPKTLHHFVFFINKCQDVRMVCYTRVRSTPKYTFFSFVQCLPHAVQSVAFDLCFNM